MGRAPLGTQQADSLTQRAAADCGRHSVRPRPPSDGSSGVLSPQEPRAPTRRSASPAGCPREPPASHCSLAQAGRPAPIPEPSPLCSKKQPLADRVWTEEDCTPLRLQHRTCREPLSRSAAPDVTRASSAASPESPDLPGNARGGGTKRGRRHSASPTLSASPCFHTTLGTSPCPLAPCGPLAVSRVSPWVLASTSPHIAKIGAWEKGQGP